MYVFIKLNVFFVVVVGSFVCVCVWFFFYLYVLCIKILIEKLTLYLIQHTSKNNMLF